MQFMLSRGETKEKSEAFVDKGLALLRYLGTGLLTVRDEPTATSLELKFKLSK
jgi:hypothetical protein